MKNSQFTHRTQTTRNRVTTASALALALVLALAACGDGGDTEAGDTGEGDAAASHEWDYYLFVPISHPAGVAAEEFAAEVNQVTGGEVEVTVRSVGEIPIKPNEALQALRNNEIQIADAYVGFISGDTTFSGVLGLPFLATTNEEGNTVVEAMREEIDSELEEFNGELLFTYDWNMQVVHGSGDPVTVPEDLSGIKARASSPQQVAFLEQVGAFPTTLTSEEVPSAMNTGVINAVLTAPMNIVGSGWDDFVDWTYLAGVNPGISFITVNQDAMAEISDESQEAIRELADEYNTSVSERLYEENDTALAAMEEAGTTIVEPDDQDIEAFRAQMRPYWEEWAAENGAEVLLDKAIQALGI